MLNTSEIMATIKMIEEQKLDIRTITMGISLLDCIADSEDATCQKVYDRITRQAQNLVKVGEDIEREFGIPSPRPPCSAAIFKTRLSWPRPWIRRARPSGSTSSAGSAPWFKRAPPRPTCA